LRPAATADSAFILSLRTDAELSRYINPTSVKLDDQQTWMRRYFARPGDYYWVIERSSTARPEGAIAIYDVDQGQAEWGRWILRKGSLAAVESALLVYRAGFDVLRLQRMFCRTVSVNRSVVSFHASCGLQTSPNGHLKVKLRGRQYDVVEQFVTAANWPAIERSLDRRAAGVARLLAR
jgi:RimJ/RimL family protein N-acetyltransferase